MSSPQSEEFSDLRWVKAVSDRSRIEILEVLDHQTASPKMLSEILNRSLHRMNYHTRVLLNAGCIEQVDTAPRRGATEHFYRSTPRSSFGHQRWRDMPQSVRGTVSATALQTFMRKAVAALKKGKIDGRDETVLNWMPMVVDQHGWLDATQVLLDAQGRLEEIHDESRRRLDDSAEEPIPMISGLAAFESVRPARRRVAPDLT